MPKNPRGCDDETCNNRGQRTSLDLHASSILQCHNNTVAKQSKTNQPQGSTRDPVHAIPRIRVSITQACPPGLGVDSRKLLYPKQRRRTSMRGLANLGNFGVQTERTRRGREPRPRVRKITASPAEVASDTVGMHAIYTRFRDGPVRRAQQAEEAKRRAARRAPCYDRQFQSGRT